MAGNKKDDTPRGSRSLLLGLVVVAATGGAMFLLGGDDDAAGSQPAVPIEAEVLEVSPLVPPGAITSASWHREAAAEPREHPDAEDATVSLLELAESGQDGTFDKSLAETVSEIHGLGVYVDTRPDDADEKKKNK